MGRAGLRADPFESLISRGPNQILDLGLCPGHTNLCLKGQKLPTKAICPRSAIDDESSPARTRDRKSTRLNSSHGYISYAVFCLKKKKTKTTRPHTTDYHCNESLAVCTI